MQRGCPGDLLKRSKLDMNAKNSARNAMDILGKAKLTTEAFPKEPPMCETWLIIYAGQMTKRYHHHNLHGGENDERRW